MKTIITIVSLIAIAWLAGSYLDLGPGKDGTTSTGLKTLRSNSAVRLLDRPRDLPDLRFVDVAGMPYKLSDFQGKIVLLNIWATWCPPCREEMPALDRLQARLGGPDFLVLPLSVDLGGLYLLKEFYDEMGLKSLKLFYDASRKAAVDLQIIGLPTTYLLDRQGRAIGITVGPATWDNEEIVSLIQDQLRKVSVDSGAVSGSAP
ncbi:MAG: TlpA disulfide reductase family protein [Gammaproteobacteria bacterium]|nr:MAG: TlpA disulfide reductase family protein [Gammaproteobacteria bacterium]